MSKLNLIKSSLLYKRVVKDNIEKRLPDLHKYLRTLIMTNVTSCYFYVDDVVMKMTPEEHLFRWNISIRFKYQFLDDEGNVAFLGGGFSLEELPNERGFLYNSGNIYNGLNLSGGITSKVYEIDVDQLNNILIIDEAVTDTTNVLNLFNNIFLSELQIFHKGLIDGLSNSTIGTDCPKMLLNPHYVS